MHKYFSSTYKTVNLFPVYCNLTRKYFLLWFGQQIFIQHTDKIERDRDRTGICYHNFVACLATAAAAIVRHLNATLTLKRPIKSY